MKKLPHTITFYLITEDAIELERLSKYRRISPQEWCKQRVVAALHKGRNKG